MHYIYIYITPDYSNCQLFILASTEFVDVTQKTVNHAICSFEIRQVRYDKTCEGLFVRVCDAGTHCLLPAASPENIVKQHQKKFRLPHLSSVLSEMAWS